MHPTLKVENVENLPENFEIKRNILSKWIKILDKKLFMTPFSADWLEIGFSPI